MLRRALSVAAVVLAPSVAQADDTAMFVNVGGSIGVGTTVDGDSSTGAAYDPEGTLAARLTLSWEPPPLPYPATRGYAFGGAFVPEVTLGYLRVADHRTGDPDDNSVLLWTRRPYADGRERAVLLVEVAEDAAFTRVIATATAPVLAQADWTCRVLVGELPPAGEYWYRFIDEDGNGSRIGRTLTAPAPDDGQLACQVIQAPDTAGARLVPDMPDVPAPGQTVKDAEIRLTYRELSALIEDAVKALGSRR